MKSTSKKKRAVAFSERRARDGASSARDGNQDLGPLMVDIAGQELTAEDRHVLRHRLVLSYQALAEQVSADRIIETVLQTVPQPRVDLARSS